MVIAQIPLIISLGCMNLPEQRWYNAIVSVLIMRPSPLIMSSLSVIHAFADSGPLTAACDSLTKSSLALLVFLMPAKSAIFELACGVFRGSFAQFLCSFVVCVGGLGLLG